MKEERIFKLTQDVIEECLEESIENQKLKRKIQAVKELLNFRFQ